MSVYFARAGRYMKVGYSADPISRSATVTLNGRRPDDLPRGADVELLGWIPGNRERERELHARFGPHWVAGEWFTLDDAEVRDLIWSDPRGVDLQRMSAMAAFASLRWPEATRDDLAAMGVPVAAVSNDDAIASLNRQLAGGAA